MTQQPEPAVAAEEIFILPFSRAPPSKYKLIVGSWSAAHDVVVVAAVLLVVVIIVAVVDTVVVAAAVSSEMASA
jgi:hypothetical protein